MLIGAAPSSSIKAGDTANSSLSRMGQYAAEMRAAGASSTFSLNALRNPSHASQFGLTAAPGSFMALNREYAAGRTAPPPKAFPTAAQLIGNKITKLAPAIDEPQFVHHQSKADTASAAATGQDAVTQAQPSAPAAQQESAALTSTSPVCI